jgi:hypothetical protein
MAHECPACGYMLPFSLRRTFAQRPATPPIPAPSEGTSDTRAAAAPRSEQEAAQHGPHAGALDPATLVPRVPASGRPTKPTLEPISVEDLVAALAADSESPPPQRGMTTPNLTTVPTSSAPVSTPRETTEGMAALSTGALLHGGKYRLLMRFGAVSAVTPRGAVDPPLFLASNAHAAGTRVLVQELPVGGMPPEEAERSMRVAAARLKEARQHTLVPEVLDSFVERGRCFLILSVPGGSRLSDIIAREGPLAEPMAVQLGVRLLDALGRFASQTPPLVHGNLCPEHVFVHPNQLVELVGISPSLLTLRSQAGAGAASGIAGYAAPEQARGHPTEQSDQYAVATILYRVTAGHAVPGQTASMQTDARAGAGKPDHRRPAKLSAVLDAILTRAQQIDPIDRYDSADEMRRALLAMPPSALSIARAGGSRLTAGPASITAGLTPAAAALRATMEIPAVTIPKRKRSRVWPILMALALLTLIGVGAFFGWQAWVRARHVPASQAPLVRTDYALKVVGLVPTWTATTPPVR